MNQERQGEARRSTSFRIDDILAEPVKPETETPAVHSSTVGETSTATAPSSSKNSTDLPCVPTLRFGVDSLLSRPSTDQSPSRYDSYYQLLPGGYWSPPYTCYTAGHGCNSCYTSGHPALSYINTAKLPVYGDMYSTYETQPSSSTSQYPQSPSGQTKTRKARRPWTRAVFSNLQRKGLEKRFQVQKYLTKADRHQLASMLGLSDNQVKVWFQNRRMKWRQDARESVTSTNTEPDETAGS